MSDVSLFVGSKIFEGWKTIRFTRSMTSLAATFSLTVSDKWKNDIPARQIKKGNRCKIEVDGQAVLTGWIDDVKPTHGPETHSITIEGRSSTSDLVDCSAGTHTTEWKGQTLLQIVASACKPFGISVVAKTDVGEKFPSESVQIGETVFELIDRLCRQRGIMAMADALGGVILTRASATHSGGSLELGVNIHKASGTDSARDRFSEYIVKGQQRSSTFLTAEQAAGPEAIIKDPAVSRYRPLIILAEAQGDIARLQKRATFERNTRAGKSLSAVITATSWISAAGKVWEPNTLVQAKDKLIDVDDDYLISSVEYLKGEDGTLANINITYPAAFDLIDFPEEPKWGF